MLSYCLKCKKNTESINARVSKTSNGKTMILSKCAICGSKKNQTLLSSYCLKCRENKKALVYNSQKLYMVEQ